MYQSARPFVCTQRGPDGTSIVQEEMAQAQRQLQAANADKAAAEQDAKHERARAGELHARCLAAEERSASLFAEAAQLRADVADKSATVAALQDEGLAVGDRAHALQAFMELLQGCALLHKCACGML